MPNVTVKGCVWMVNSFAALLSFGVYVFEFEYNIINCGVLGAL